MSQLRRLKHSFQRNEYDEMRRPSTLPQLLQLSEWLEPTACQLHRSKPWLWIKGHFSDCIWKIQFHALGHRTPCFLCNSLLSTGVWEPNSCWHFLGVLLVLFECSNIGTCRHPHFHLATCTEYWQILPRKINFTRTTYCTINWILRFRCYCNRTYFIAA